MFFLLSSLTSSFGTHLPGSTEVLLLMWAAVIFWGFFFFARFHPEAQEQAEACPRALSLKRKEETSVFSNETEIPVCEAFYKRLMIMGIYRKWILL